MSPLQKILGGTLIAIMALAAVFLSHQKAHERMGKPGIKNLPIPGKINCDFRCGTIAPPTGFPWN